MIINRILFLHGSLFVQIRLLLVALVSFVVHIVIQAFRAAGGVFDGYQWNTFLSWVTLCLNPSLLTYILCTKAFRAAGGVLDGWQVQTFL